MQSTCIVSESTKGDGRTHLSLAENFGTFSFACFSSDNVDTQDGDNEAAAKSYSETMYASVNTERKGMRLWFARRAVIALNYSWNVIHHNLTTATTAPMKRHQKDKMRDTTCERKMNNKAKRIIWEEDFEEEARARCWVWIIFISLAVVHTKQWWGTFVCYWTRLKKNYSRWSRFGSCFFPSKEI